jgi:hypothetical protein
MLGDALSLYIMWDLMHMVATSSGEQTTSKSIIMISLSI